MVTTGSTDFTVLLENGRTIYPCRCGEIHEGEYAFERWNHHNCFHNYDLIGVPVDKSLIQAICPECGASWLVKMAE